MGAQTTELDIQKQCVYWLLVYVNSDFEGVILNLDNRTFSKPIFVSVLFSFVN